ncbi:hypothetical protein BAE44_0021113 [Dichanthelium oligosanthes]|uniref:Uncharacterized protein n=1 Tax=Dichanthelium oligosanthes TaxID=888268 RepID=A0A1E5UYE3_9POAL|nr:hypothetical protein BAE44_0021113 [Dichanthelium oligosanthes]
MMLLEADRYRGHDLNTLGESPLDMAAREGLVQVVQCAPDIVEILMEKRADLIDMSASVGNSALRYAAQKNHSRAVEILLDRRPELAYTRNGKRQSPLHVAAYHGSRDAIKALLRQCPDVAEMVDADGYNAF